MVELVLFLALKFVVLYDQFGCLESLESERDFSFLGNDITRTALSFDLGLTRLVPHSLLEILEQLFRQTKPCEI